MTSKKNLTNSIMNDEEKQRLNESREELKTIKDAIRYQKLLLSAESKLKTKKLIKEKIARYQNRKKELETRIKVNPKTIERKDKREKKKQEKSASKIQKWFRRQYTEKVKYSINILLYGYRNDIETMSEEVRL